MNVGRAKVEFAYGRLGVAFTVWDQLAAWGAPPAHFEWLAKMPSYNERRQLAIHWDQRLSAHAVLAAGT